MRSKPKKTVSSNSTPSSLPSSNEHGFCPKCGEDFDGDDIIETFVKQGYTRDGAERAAANYGYGPGRTKWSKVIGIYDWDKDRTVGWRCPKCHYYWDC